MICLLKKNPFKSFPKPWMSPMKLEDWRQNCLAHKRDEKQYRPTRPNHPISHLRGKTVGRFSMQNIILQGKFSTISAFSIENSRKAPITGVFLPLPVLISMCPKAKSAPARIVATRPQAPQLNPWVTAIEIDDHSPSVAPIINHDSAAPSTNAAPALPSFAARTPPAAFRRSRSLATMERVWPSRAIPSCCVGADVVIPTDRRCSCESGLLPAGWPGSPSCCLVPRAAASGDECPCRTGWWCVTARKRRSTGRKSSG